MSTRTASTHSHPTSPTPSITPGLPPEVFARVVRHQSLVRIIVARMCPQFPSHADFEELQSAGMTGLIAAARRFNPDRGFTFETYASIRIRGAILDELRKLDMVPRSIRNHQRRFARAVESLEQSLGRVPHDHEVAACLNLSLSRYRRLRAQTEPMSVVFLDKARSRDEPSPHDAIADESEIPFTERLERDELIELIAQRMRELPEKEQKVLALNYYEGLKLAEIGEVMGLSEARVSQIRSHALATLRKFVNRMTY